MDIMTVPRLDARLAADDGRLSRRRLAGRLLAWLVVAACLAACGASPLAAPAAPAATATGQPAARTVTDMMGTTVTLPATVDRVADGWPAHNGLLLMLGAGDKLVATIASVQQIPWFQRVYPRIGTLPAPFAENVNTEELLRAHPDVVFLSQSDAGTLQRLRALGLPVVQLYFTDFDQLKQSFVLTGSVLGGDHAVRAQRYASYLDEHLASITARTATISADHRPSVVHLASVEPLKVDGRNSIIDQWISTAGARNAAHDDIDGNLHGTSLEQLLTWNPDVLIVGGTVGQVEQIKSDPRWQRLKAVQAGKVYLNPKGVFPWDRYGPEEALQIQWAAQTLQPSLFQDVDVVQATRAFYRDFFSYELTDGDVADIMAPRS